MVCARCRYELLLPFSTRYAASSLMRLDVSCESCAPSPASNSADERVLGTSAQIRELEADIEVLLTFDRARATAHYEQRARGLREARTKAKAQLAELAAEEADAVTRMTNDAIAAAIGNRVSTPTRTRPASASRALVMGKRRRGC